MLAKAGVRTGRTRLAAYCYATRTGISDWGPDNSAGKRTIERSCKDSGATKNKENVLYCEEKVYILHRSV